MPRRNDADANAALDIDHAVAEYRYPDKRKNIPVAGLAAEAKVKEAPRVKFAYDPHLPPALRFDPTGSADRLPELLQTAAERKLTADEIQLLADALRRQEPALDWAGKRERKECEVDPVALHIHERVSAQAVLRLAARQDIAPNLFADPQQQYHEAIQFYKHDVEWANRLILGDSLQVMASLSQREDLAGKVQMIYMDPPYGIKFGSNFQAQVGKKDVKDGKDEDLTREPEVVKAYRDTWELGVHSYLTYLRDRLHLVKYLLTDSGSVFVQISNENLHRVRLLMDEVFGPENFISIISFATTSSQTTKFLPDVSAYLIWYAKRAERAIEKYRSLKNTKVVGGAGTAGYTFVEMPNGIRRALSAEEIDDPSILPEKALIYRYGDITSSGHRPKGSLPITLSDNTYEVPKDRHWSIDTDELPRAWKTGRLEGRGKRLEFVRLLNDNPVFDLTNTWNDTGSTLSGDKMYVVQTNSKVIERCMLMTTDPGDLVLDPTCGSGTTAYVAEQWARRWITIDSSRVSLAIARQRLLTSKFDYYKMRPVTAEDTSRSPNGLWLRDPQGQIDGACTFQCKTVPHVTLKSIAQNQALDPIFARWEPVLEKHLVSCNWALANTVTPDLRNTLKLKLAAKEKQEGRKSITDADRRRWLLPVGEWKEWEVPFDIDPQWPEPLLDAVTKYRAAWRQKMDEVNRAIAARAEQEELVDQPAVHRGILRVSGPFTVEGVKPAEQSLDLYEDAFAGEPDVLDTFTAESSTNGTAAGREVPTETVNAGAYLDRMISLLRADEVRFPNNKTVKFTHLSPLNDDTLHAEGTWETGGEEHRVAVVFGPQYGPVTVPMVADALHRAGRRGYDDLLIAGFSFDAMAQASIDDDPNPRVRCHMSHIRPDVNPAMNGLLKKTQSSQLFTVSGLPRVELEDAPNGEHSVVMEGVDIYDPIGNTVQSAGADKVAAWFVDSDYNGETFCICQAFFPDPKAWEKIANDIRIKGLVDPEQFATFSGTRSLPFPTGKHKRVAVKVIDPRGNEVMRVLPIGGVQYV